MSDAVLEALAAEAGIAPRWEDWRGTPRTVSAETLRALLSALELPCASASQIRDSRARLAQEQGATRWPALLTATAGDPVSLPAAAVGLEVVTVLLEAGGQRTLPVQRDPQGHPQLAAIAEWGYHQLLVGSGTPPLLAVAPRKAFSVAQAAQGRRGFGLSAQVYSLRRAGDGGIGDFGAVAELARSAGAQGADALALSPTHALFAAEPDRFAPYSPSSRRFLNPLHADPAMVLGEPVFRAALQATGLGETYAALEQPPLIDYGAAARAKWKLLRALWGALAAELQAGFSPLSQRFLSFCAEGGVPLGEHARFEALHAQHQAQGLGHWQGWPVKHRDAQSSAVEAYAKSHAVEVNFHRFAQWLASESLAAAQAAARGAGMAIGLIGDLAVGTDGAGSQAWARPHELLRGVGIGAPPDPLALQGQNWGLTTFSPRALQAQGFAPFLDLLRANLRHVGGLRIDHVLGLQRLWLVPEGASEGAYLRYPRQDLLRLVALESHRHRAIVIGEDLGTLPEGFQDTLADSGVLGLRVLYFQRDHRLFIDPSRWSADAVATTTTHDLPTVAGWWEGRDLAWRSRLGLSDAAQKEEDEVEREEGRYCLWGALAHAGLVRGAKPVAETPEELVEPAAAYVARTPAPLVLLPVEDVLGLGEAPNLPGTTSGHPNWQRRLPGETKDLLESVTARERLARVRRERKAV